MTGNKIVKLLILGIFLFLGFLSFVIKNHSIVNAYSCPAGYYCEQSGGTIWGWLNRAPSGYPPNCAYIHCRYDCWGTNSACYGGCELNSSLALCEADADPDIGSYCCNKVSCPYPNCSPNPSCPSDTTTTDTGDVHSTDTDCCDTGPSPCPENCETETCYCYLCDIDSVSCDDLDEVNQSWGSYPRYKSCRNTPVGANCDTRYKTCYCYEPPEPPLCPTPLLESNPADAPNMILPDFTYTYNICSVYKYHDCYEPVSPQPIESLQIHDDGLNGYGFSSTTHTGTPQLTTNTGNLNDPINMTATYTDTDGASDIEALGVWFRNDGNTGEVNSPIWLSTTVEPKASSNDNWGFMMVRDPLIVNNWIPYVPSWNANPAVWTSRNTQYNPATRTFVIKGPNGNNMVEVVITSPISSSNQTVTMDFSLRFSGSTITESVSQTTYDILLMGLDTFSFTPYDNYTFPASDNWRSTVQDNPSTSAIDYWEVNKLRYRSTPAVAQTYAREWSYSNAPSWLGNKWTVDKIAPVISFINNTPSASSVIGNTIKIEWNATDEKNLYSIVGNIYTTAELQDIGSISIVQASSGVTLQYDLGVPFTPTLSTSIGNIIGNLDTGWHFKVNPNINGASHTGSITIEIGDNREGSLIFYLTAFDDAGNVSMPQYDDSIFNINDWLVTDGGLMYSLGGTTFATKTFSIDPSWSGILPPFPISATESLLYNISDLSSELFAQGPSTTAPSSLVNSSLTKSYNIKYFPETKVKSYYDNFLQAYERNKSKINPNDLAEEVLVSPLNGKNGLNPACGGNKEYCVLTVNGDLAVNTLPNSELTCDRKTTIFVDGNLEINPPILNGNTVGDINNETGCIFIVSGGVVINEGSDAASDPNFAYDVINAYILADGKVTISSEESKIPQGDPDMIDDADNVLLWTSSDTANTTLHQDSTSYVEEPSSIEVRAEDVMDTTSEVVDLMEYNRDFAAQAAYPGGGGVIATGGSTSTVGSDTIHTFTSSGTLNVTKAGPAQVLVVGGGGGGGGGLSYGGGGGGGGAAVYNSNINLSAGSITVTVGAGGAGGAPGNGGNGGSSSLVGYLSAVGGGGGGAIRTAGRTGGCGGGAGKSDEFESKSAGSGSVGYGGGRTQSSTAGLVTGGGGGGGMGSGGGSSVNTATGGTGGSGKGFSISGSSVNYAGGGGGSAKHSPGSGRDGGGKGSWDWGSSAGQCGRATSGAANSGSGGGGGGGDTPCGYPNGGSGGSGIVIVRYTTGTGVMVYSEQSIKQEGSYALKVVADQTSSLNKTATRTFTTPLNLSGNTYLSFYMRSSRTGSNVSVGIRDTGGVVTQITPTVTTANTYQKYTMNLSAVADANKDAINQLIITITNADATNTFYIDNVVSGYEVPASLNDVVSTSKAENTKSYDSIHLSLRSTQAGAIVRFQFGKNVYSEFHDLTITDTNQWQDFDFNISRSNNNLYGFRIMNLNPGESFWFDDIRYRNIFDPSAIDYGEIIDGVYINGGLHSLWTDSGINSGPSIEVMRYLRLEERLDFPVLVVDQHPKYGKLAEDFFGNSYTLQKTEVGFKP